MANKTKSNPCLPCVALALNPQERRVAGKNPTAKAGQFLLMAEDACAKDWSKPQSRASGKVVRLVRGKASALIAAKNFMADKRPHKDFQTPVGFKLTAFVSIRDHQGNKVGYWVGKDGKWVDVNTTRGHPKLWTSLKKAGSDAASSFKKSRASAAAAKRERAKLAPRLPKHATVFENEFSPEVMGWVGTDYTPSTGDRYMARLVHSKPGSKVTFPWQRYFNVKDDPKAKQTAIKELRAAAKEYLSKTGYTKNPAVETRYGTGPKVPKSKYSRPAHAPSAATQKIIDFIKRHVGMSAQDDGKGQLTLYTSAWTAKDGNFTRLTTIPATMEAARAAVSGSRLRMKSPKTNPKAAARKRLSTYGNVFNGTYGDAKGYVVGIFQQRKGDSYHARLVSMADRVLWKRDFYIANTTAADAKKSAIEALRAAGEKHMNKTTKKNPPRGQVDNIAATELLLYAQNERAIYPQRQSIEKNLRQKVKRGKYDHKRAPQLWLYWMDTAAKRYTKEFSAPGDKWSDIFNKPTREAAAKVMADEFKDELDLEAKENPCKTRPRPATRKRRPRLSMARRHAILNPGPRKKYIGVIGDNSPIEHQGGIIYDAGYGPTLTYFQPYDERVSIYTISIADDVEGEMDWVDWAALASYQGMDEAELRGYARSKDVLARASVYEVIGSRDGFRELDYSPEDMTLEAAERKWNRSVDAAHKAGQKRARKNPIAGRRKGKSKAKATAKKTAKKTSRRTGQSRPWITKDGKLTGAAFLTKSVTQRHRMLDGCVKKYSYRSCVGTLQTLYRDSGSSITQGRKLDQDRKYLVDKHGGSSGQGARIATTSNAMVAQVARDLDSRAKRAGVATPKKRVVRRPATAKKKAKRVSAKRPVPRRNPGRHAGITAGQIIGAVTR